MALPIKIPYLPMEALLVEEIPSGKQWQYEPKWDGFRGLAFKDHDQVELQSKNGQLLARYFPELIAALKELKAKQFVIDGEIVIAANGSFSFDLLLQRIHPAASRVRMLSETHPALFMAFDLLVRADGQALVSHPLKSRRRELEAFARQSFPRNGRIQLSPATTELKEAQRWFKLSGGNLDGIVAKDLELSYQSGERRGMQKVKRLRTADCVVDGLRLDATQNMYDSSENHILHAITERVRRAGAGRSTLVIAENEPQNTQIVRSAHEGGYAMDGVWNDDFHHSAIVALTARREAYYNDYTGKPQEFISAAKRGFLYQGQHYRWQKKRRGTSTDGLKPSVFVNYLENHDQVANRGPGLRLHRLADPGIYRAITALFLLAPQTPLLQGQEFAASSPFTLFADHDPELAVQVREGRFEFLRQFPSLASEQMQPRLPDPTDSAVFASCRLDLSERERHREAYALHRDLLKLRREDTVFNAQRPCGVDGAVLTSDAFVLRYFATDGNDRLLIVNFGTDIYLSPVPEPLLAPPRDTEWHLLWYSENPQYGGSGALPMEKVESWFIPGKGAFVFAAFV